MSAITKSVEILQKRLKEIDNSVTSEELENLAKSVVSLSQIDNVDNVSDIAEKKLVDIETCSQEKLEDLHNIDFSGPINEEQEIIYGELSELKTLGLEEITDKYSAETSVLNELGDNFINLNDVPEDSSVMAAIEEQCAKIAYYSPETLPFIFGILSRYDDYWGTATFSSELGTWYNSTSGANYMLGLLAGCHNYSTEYAGFYLEPKLCYLQGVNGNFIRQKNYKKYDNTTTQYTYPYAALGALFVENTTDEDITSTLNFGGTSYSSSYAGASMFVGTPNKSNAEKAATSSVSWTNVYSYSSSNSGFSSSASVTIPANTTVAVIFYTSSYYITSTYGYAQFLSWYLTNVRSGFLTPGLKIDWERTRNAWQCKGLANTYGLWQ